MDKIILNNSAKKRKASFRQIILFLKLRGIISLVNSFLKVMETNNRRGAQKTEEYEREDTICTNVYSSKDNKSMHKPLNSEFILYQMLLERVLDEKQPLPEAAQDGLTKYFQPESSSDQRTMKEFDTIYQAEGAIHWYTRKTCIWKILNKALRTHNIDDIQAFAHFIRDLHSQLEDEHEKFAEVQKLSIIKVYRGQFISKDEVNRLKSTKGQLISMNSFVSTSTNKNRSLEFAKSRSPPNDDLTSIFLEINATVKSPNRPFADIRHLSAFTEEEEEFLFMFGCVFRLDNIYFDEKVKLWRAELTLCTDNDEDLKDFVSTVNSQLGEKDKLLSLGTYLFQMHKYDQAEKHYQNILQSRLIDDPIQLAHCHHGLAQVKIVKDEYNLAIENLEKAIDYIVKNNEKRDHPLLSECYNNLGAVYAEQENYPLATHFYDKAFRTTNNVPSVICSNIAQMHFKLNNYKLVLKYLQETLDNQSEEEHSSVANI